MYVLCKVTNTSLKFRKISFKTLTENGECVSNSTSSRDEREIERRKENVDSKCKINFPLWGGKGPSHRRSKVFTDGPKIVWTQCNHICCKRGEEVTKERNKRYRKEEKDDEAIT